MTRSKMRLFTLIILVLAVAPRTISQEKHIQRADLPRAVQRSSAVQSKGAMVRYTTETEGGKLEYQVEMTVDGRSKDVSMDRMETCSRLRNRKTFRQSPRRTSEKAGEGTITKVESIAKRGTLVALGSAGAHWR
jgi:hypothetical protein